MFNNTFNRNRKDPLVDSIKAIMEDTNMRNQAEGLVCEAFGVFNANALANEDIEIFKDACEFVYSQLKEGVQLDELLGRGKLDAAVKSHLEKKGYTHTKSKDPQGGTRHSFEKAAKTPFKGEKKGFSYTRYKEKGEKHGDVNFGYYSKSAKSKKPNYGESGNDPESNLPSLVKSMKEGNDGNLANNYPPYDKVTRGDVIAGRLGKDQMGGKRKKMEEEQIDERNLLKRMKDTMRLGSSGKERVDRISGALSDRGGNWDYKKGDFTEKGKSQVKSRLKNVKGASDYALNKEETQIDELSRDTLKSYVKKASKDMRKTAWTAGKETESDDYWGATGKDRRDRKHISKSGKRLRGIQKATDRLEEEQIDELYGKGKLKDIIAARQEKEHKAKLAYKRAENKMMDARSETGKAEKVKEKLRLRNISKPGDPHYNWAHSKRKISEEVFEEIYISINEQALYAIETNQLEAFINNLTEEEYDFLDEEIVEAIDSSMMSGTPMGGTGGFSKKSVGPSTSKFKATSSISSKPSSSGSGKIDWSGFKDFSSKNPNATKGQYANAVTGKTAKVGGANDPSVIQKGLDAKGKGQTAFNPNPTGNESGKEGISNAMQNAQRATGGVGSTNSVASKPAPAPKSDWLHSPEGGGIPKQAADSTPEKTPAPENKPSTGWADAGKINTSGDATALSKGEAGKAAAGVATNSASAGSQDITAKKVTSVKVEESFQHKGFVTVGNMRIKLL